MIEWWLSSFFKDGKCETVEDGRKPLDEYLQELREDLTKDDVNNKQKLKEDLEVFIGGYVEIVNRIGVSINAYNVIRDIDIPEITDLQMSGDLYFKFKGVDCSVVPDGRLFVY